MQLTKLFKLFPKLNVSSRTESELLYLGKKTANDRIIGKLKIIFCDILYTDWILNKSRTYKETTRLKNF